MSRSLLPEVHDSGQSVPLLRGTVDEESGMGALNYLSEAAHRSMEEPVSPTTRIPRSPGRNPGSNSPIKRILETNSSHSSDEEANLVIVENPDGSLVEGMPLGFKHSTPFHSAPPTPRLLNFGISGADLIDLFKRHERIFIGLLICAVLIDAVVLSEEFTTIVGAIMSMNGHIRWDARLGSVLPYMDQLDPSGASVTHINTLSETHVRRTFSVFPPHWQLGWSLTIAGVDSIVCLAFLASGIIAYVSKYRKAYAWFGTISCTALVWQVVLSCVDKLSLVLFLMRLAAFTHARFMGDLMDDITLLATLITGRQVIAQVEQLRPRLNPV